MKFARIDLLLAALALCALAPRANLQGKPDAPKPAVAPLVAWAELARHPSLHLGERVRLDLQFHSRVESWSPYMTRFGPVAFQAWQLWPDEQFPWIKEDYDSPAARLFARRGTPADFTLAAATKAQRFSITAIVREVFVDSPWLEIESVSALPEQISEGTTIHAARAIDLARQGSWALAVGEFDQSLAGDLPTAARKELERLRDQCKTQQAALREPPSGSKRVAPK